MYGVLYIHAGLKERAPIAEDDFKVFMNVADAKIMEAVWSGQWDLAKNIRFPWNIWVKNSGIISCLNEASMDYMVELAKTITLPGKTFKGWKKGEYGLSILVTLILPPGSDAIKREIVVPLILKQNSLVGQHTTPRFKTKSDVTLVTMGVSPDLAAGLRNLRGFGGMGARDVKVQLQKDEPEDEDDTDVKKEAEDEKTKPEMEDAKNENQGENDVDVNKDFE